MRLAALLNGRFFHYLDHLVPLCDYLNVPLITDEPQIADSARRYYPHIEIIELSPFELTYAYLDENFDWLFVTEKYKRAEMAPYLKHSRFCYIPHGNSDKGELCDALDPYPLQEIALIYGQQMADKITIPTIRIGNLRWHYYQKHRPFFDAQIKLNPAQLTILYAPSWDDGERGSSFTSHCLALLAQLPDDVQLIVKLHPLLYERAIGACTAVIERYREKKNIHFILDSPLIYPLLSHCDLYLGDYSSIGYDFLAFDRPLFFFHTSPHSAPRLNQVGIAIPENEAIFPFIKKNLGHNLGELRRQLYAYAFDDVKPEGVIIQSLMRSTYARDPSQTVR